LRKTMLLVLFVKTLPIADPGCVARWQTDKKSITYA
jgi:hypothetical protein